MVYDSERKKSQTRFFPLAEFLISIGHKHESTFVLRFGIFPTQITYASKVFSIVSRHTILIIGLSHDVTLRSE